jgi:hypothetical protein
MVRKRVIDKPQNLNHNVVPKRAEIGQIITNNAVYNADCRSVFFRVADDPLGTIDKNCAAVRGLSR